MGEWNAIVRKEIEKVSKQVGRQAKRVRTLASRRSRSRPGLVGCVVSDEAAEGSGKVLILEFCSSNMGGRMEL